MSQQESRGEGWDYEPEYASDDWASRRGYEIATAYGFGQKERMAQADDIAAQLCELRDHLVQVNQSAT